MEKTLKFENTECFCNNLQRLPLNPPVGNTENNYFSLFADRPFCKMVAQETPKLSPSPIEIVVYLIQRGKTPMLFKFKHMLVY
jgi:hypothetical protein